MKEKITISSGHGIKPDQIYIKKMEFDNRWWKRLYYFVIKKDEPTITKFYSILSIDSETEFTIRIRRL